MSVHSGTGRGPGHMNRNTSGTGSAASPLTLRDRSASAITDRSGSTILTRI